MKVYVCVLMTDNDTGSPWEDIIKVVADEMVAIDWECENPLKYDSNQYTWNEYKEFEVEYIDGEQISRERSWRD